MKQSKSALAYLVSEYPAISHTFISREVSALRKLGRAVHTFSIRRPAHYDSLSPGDQDEARKTQYLKERILPAGMVSYVKQLFTHPRGTLKLTMQALGYALRRPTAAFRFGAYVLEATLLADSMRSAGVNHVHVHFGNPAATVALLMSQYEDLSYSLSLHGPDIFDNVADNLLKEKVEKASFVRCISNYCKSQLLRLVNPEIWDRFHIVRCGIDPENHCLRPQPSNAVPELLCVGRLVPAKGQHVLLRACRQLSDRDIPYRLTFVGNGPDRSSLEQYATKLGISQQVHFVGQVGQHEVHEYYDKADIFVLPSFAEGLPVVLMEAMAKGVPCVTTQITGVPELISNGVNGVLVPPTDAVALANEIARLIEDPEERERIGRSGRDAVMERYQLDVNCQELADFLVSQV